MTLGDDDLMPFGKHKGIPMQDVPDGWLLWFYNANAGIKVLGASQQAVFNYAKLNLDAIKLNVERSNTKHYGKSNGFFDPLTL
jgi:uncharacterized protein (DUF3820 family)